jgi:hypothetical protein
MVVEGKKAGDHKAMLAGAARKFPEFRNKGEISWV